MAKSIEYFVFWCIFSLLCGILSPLPFSIWINKNMCVYILRCVAYKYTYTHTRETLIFVFFFLQVQWIPCIHLWFFFFVYCSAFLVVSFVMYVWHSEEYTNSRATLYIRNEAISWWSKSAYYNRNYVVQGHCTLNYIRIIVIRATVFITYARSHTLTHSQSNLFSNHFLFIAYTQHALSYLGFGLGLFSFTFSLWLWVALVKAKCFSNWIGARANVCTWCIGG